MLALFLTKFVCNLAIRYLVFRWELCKGSVRECEENTRFVQFKRVSRLDLTTGLRLASHQNGTRVKHAGGAKGSQ